MASDPEKLRRTNRARIMKVNGPARQRLFLQRTLRLPTGLPLPTHRAGGHLGTLTDDWEVCKRQAGPQTEQNLPKGKDAPVTERNSFNAMDELNEGGKRYAFFSLPKAAAAGLHGIERLPYCLQVLLENALRHEDGETVKRASIEAFSRWVKDATNPTEISFFPTRIMMHDVSGIPLLADLAAMREHMVSTGGDPRDVNPIRPVDFIMDHSVIADVAGQPNALALNTQAEFRRNAERYRVAKWAQKAFRGMRVLPPGQGICHQINLETLARVVWSEQHREHGLIAFPDSLVAGDSHTPMINALSVLGWGVGAIEALSAMLGEPVSMLIPDVVGVRLVGRLPEGATTTDLVLALTRTLREYGVVQKFVEYFGPGLDSLSLPERATLANMAPEYGASVGFFPTDAETIDFLHLTGRAAQAPLVEAYCKAQGMWRDDTIERVYSHTLEFDVSTVQASLAGPKLPQSQIPLNQVHLGAVQAIASNRLRPEKDADNAQRQGVTDGDIVIAAITSCTNTSNPSVMLAAGLLAKKAHEKGLTAKPWVKTSLSPGSRTVADYLESAGLIAPLEALGFHITGFGCMTCCGGSGSLAEDITRDIVASDLSVAAVLSGNRNFEGRIHPQVDLAYLGSPPLVVAYALLGTMVEDITTASLGHDRQGQPVHLKDIWPSAQEIESLSRTHVTQALFESRYADIEKSDEWWDGIDAGDGGAYTWDRDSTYILKPPFLETAKPQRPMRNIEGAAVLAMFGDSLTTDHISPGSRILEGSLAGDYLAAKGVPTADFSGFLQRRTNHHVMMRGTFNNPHIQNEMTPERRGGWTVYQPSGAVVTIFDAHKLYADAGRALVVIAGREYGTGSSRDWAARGPHLLGTRAIIAESFERIHRCNLVGMGILPLQFQNSETRNSLGLVGSETVDILGLSGGVEVNQTITARFTKPDGVVIDANVVCRLDTAREIAWFEAGGVMPYVLEKLNNAA
ncbi:MAG: aconitate hydratase [Gammaproteobacteria bacterium]